jgi:hypothetical protein
MTRLSRAQGAPFVREIYASLTRSTRRSAADRSAVAARFIKTALGIGTVALAQIVKFPRTARSANAERSERGVPEIVVFPRTNIRVLRKLWGLPEYGPLIAGPDGRAVGVSGEDALAG